MQGGNRVPNPKPEWKKADAEADAASGNAAAGTTGTRANNAAHAALSFHLGFTTFVKFFVV